MSVLTWENTERHCIHGFCYTLELLLEIAFAPPHQDLKMTFSKPLKCNYFNYWWIGTTNFPDRCDLMVILNIWQGD